MFYLSESDLLLLEGYDKDYRLYNPKKLKEILHQNGLDSSKHIEIRLDTHRNLRNQAFTGFRFCGIERTDKEWLGTGAASLEAHIFSSKDKSLRGELQGMSKEGMDFDTYKNMVERAEVAGVL